MAEKINLTFANGEPPALNANNMNKIVSAINDSIEDTEQLTNVVGTKASKTDLNTANANIDKLNKTLDAQGFGEESGSGNLFKRENVINGYIDATTGQVKASTGGDTSVILKVKPNTQYTIDNGVTTTRKRIASYTSYPSVGTNGTMLVDKGAEVLKSTSFTTRNDSQYVVIFFYNSSGEPNSLATVLDNTQIVEGTNILVPYRPYIESNLMLGNEVSNLKQSLDDEKFLGWSVPTECPIQNYVDANGDFHQRVGRIKLSTFTLITAGGKKVYGTPTLPSSKAGYWDATVPKLYVAGFTTIAWGGTNGMGATPTSKSINITPDKVLYFYDPSMTDISTFQNSIVDKYLYYELATEVVIKCGNEAVEKLNQSLKLDVVSGIELQVNNKVCIVSFSDVRTSAITTSGITLPKAAKYTVSNVIKYYDETSNVIGFVYIAAGSNKLFLYKLDGNKTSGTYIVGSITFLSD